MTRHAVRIGRWPVCLAAAAGGTTWPAIEAGAQVQQAPGPQKLPPPMEVAKGTKLTCLREKPKPFPTIAEVKNPLKVSIKAGRTIEWEATRVGEPKTASGTHKPEKALPPGGVVKVYEGKVIESGTARVGT
jgi:hypothetical protein